MFILWVSTVWRLKGGDNMAGMRELNSYLVRGTSCPPEVERVELDVHDLNAYQEVLEDADLTPEEHAYMMMQAEGRLVD